MLPVVDVKTMQQSDRATIESGTPSRELMLRAARGILQSYSWKDKTLIVCGKGNNAGDGYALAQLMQEKHLSCELLLLCDKFSEDGRYYFERCLEQGIPHTFWNGSFDFSPYSQIVDCIFGIGFCGTVDENTATLIQAINESSKTVISADINSGLGGDDGLGTPSIKSDLTIAIQSFKPGHFLAQAKDVIGQQTCIDIGIATPDQKIYLLEETDVASLFEERKNHSHKGNYGYVAVMGGSVEYSGAAKLANMSAAALRAGCGVVTLAVPETIVQSVSPYLLESTLLPIPADENGKYPVFRELLLNGYLPLKKAESPSWKNPFPLTADERSGKAKRKGLYVPVAIAKQLAEGGIGGTEVLMCIEWEYALLHVKDVFLDDTVDVKGEPYALVTLLDGEIDFLCEKCISILNIGNRITLFRNAPAFLTEENSYTYDHKTGLLP